MNKHWIYFLFITLLPACTKVDPVSSPPNIILINVDDIGYGDFEPYGQQLIKTPFINQMAREGALFSNFYAGSTVCGPSRAALLTGLHTGNLRDCGNGQDSLSIHFETWPQLLQKNGYRTAMFGKQHGALLDSTVVIGDSPIDRGFDEFMGWLNAVDAHQHFIDGKTNGWDRRDYLFRSHPDGTIMPYRINATRYVQNEFLSHGLDFIQKNKDTSFFLYLPFTIGHAELAVPKPGDPNHDSERHEHLWEQYLDDDGQSIFPEFDYRGDNIYARPVPYLSRATFAAMVSHLDRDVGEILALLRSLEIEKNTLVLLTSDNGPADEGGIDRHQIDGKIESPFNSNGIFQGFKRSLHEGGIRVPMIAWWPGRIREGLRVDDYFANYDIGATILNLTRSPNLRNTDGVSFLSSLIEEKDRARHEFLYWEWRDHQAVRFDQYKAIRKVNQGPADPVELYDLTRDPAEEVDLSAVSSYQDILKKAITILNRETSGTACRFIPLKR